MTFLRLEKHIPAPHGIGDAEIVHAPRLELPFFDRSKSRLRATLSNGIEAAIFLPRGTVLRGGDLLAAEDGSLVAVHSAAERVLVVTASERLTLMRAAYHLGNRHIPVELGESELKIEHDAVLADMLSRLGASVEEKALPFEPEAGAYVSKLGGGHRHGHDATFEDDHALAQAAFKSHAKPEHPAEPQYGEPGQKHEYRRRAFAPDAHPPDSVQREMRFAPRRPRPK